jgi:lysophospholipase
MSMAELPTIESLGGRQEFVTTGDGTRLRYARFRPDNPVARTLLFPGFTEFIEKHLETIAELLERDHEVLCVDWRGQGLSDRALPDRHRGHISSMELFLSDLREILEMSEFAAGAKPGRLNVIGHSMGGHLALRAAGELGLPFDRIIVIAPMIDILTGPFPRALAPLLARAAVMLGLAGWYPPGAGGYDDSRKVFEGNPLTSDRERFQRTHDLIARDPRLALGNPTFGWINAAFASIRRLVGPSLISKVRQPVLMFRAGEEKIVSNAAQENLCQELSNARLVDLPDARHEILNETDAIRAMFWSEVDEFFQDLHEV